MTTPRIAVTRITFLLHNTVTLASRSARSEAPAAAESQSLWTWADEQVSLRRSSPVVQGGERADRSLDFHVLFADGFVLKGHMELDGHTSDDWLTRTQRSLGLYSREDWPLSLHAQQMCYMIGNDASLRLLHTHDLGADHAEVLARSRVRAALRNTREDYLRACLAQRVPGHAGSAGSTFRVTGQMDLLRLLHDAEWKPYQHSAVLPACTAFCAPIPGDLGIVSVRDLSDEARVVLSDPKGTGDVHAHVRRSYVADVLVSADFAVMILGPNEEDTSKPEMVWTFHPGEPVRPSVVKAASGVESETVSPREAIARGFEFAKVTP